MVALTVPDTYQFRIYGAAAPQGSKRHLGRGILVEASKRVAPWRQDVMLQTRQQYNGLPLSEPVSMSIIFWLARPKNHYRTGKHAGELKPNAPTHSTSAAQGDIDKLCRSTLDGLSAKCGGCIIADDSIVVAIQAEKRYATDAESCGALITVSHA